PPSPPALFPTSPPRGRALPCRAAAARSRRAGGHHPHLRQATPGAPRPDRPGALDVATARLLEAMVAAGMSIPVSGPTGTGKTTLLNVLERPLFVSGEPKAPLCYLPSAARVPRGANAVAHPTPCGLSRGGLLLEHSSGDRPRHLRRSLGAGRGG